MNARTRILGLIVLCGLAPAAVAGPLHPPAGPVASTGTPLSEMEPRTVIGPATTPGDADSVYRITEPGSYVLAANVIGEDGKKGIEIASPGVSIDLNGFSLVGVPGSLAAVRSEPHASGASVSNGSITDWDGAGVHLLSSGGCHVSGVRVAGSGSTAVLIGDGGLVEECVAVGSTYGYYLLPGAVARGCTAESMLYSGFSAVRGATLEGCAAENCASDGFSARGGSVLRGCTASANGVDGIHLDRGSTAIECVAVDNASYGIRADDDCVVLSCTALENGDASSTGAGIFLFGSGSRVEGNHTALNKIGIRATGSGNLIIRNSARGNTANSFSLAGGNAAGPIIAGSQVATFANPNCNIAY
ncbi:MAG: right-handed parallel beta-helix repeat-containing protein [Planctomycetota bacterium]